MKVCFFGLGSIGKRHLKNLHAVCETRGLQLDVTALRVSKQELPIDVKTLVQKEIFHEHDLDNNYDIIFITNPTSKHYETLYKHINISSNFFIEKPVFDKCHDLSFLKNEGLYYVACPLRYNNVVLGIKRMVDDGATPVSVRAICSSYLPDWRPNVDYRQTYSAQKELGGGVSIDLVHEMDYITNLFGIPLEVVSVAGKYSNLEINSDDLALYILKYKDKLIEIHLDYFGRTSKREIELYCNDKKIVGDILKNQISISSEKEPMVFSEQPNDKYIREIEYFLDCIKSRIKTNNEVSNAQKILKLARQEY